MHGKLQFCAAGHGIVTSDEEDIEDYHSSGDDESEKIPQCKKFLSATTDARQNASQ